MKRPVIFIAAAVISLMTFANVPLPNDIGAFRASKMAALHNTLSVPGFVMEMTVAVNKINYFTF